MENFFDSICCDIMLRNHNIFLRKSLCEVQEDISDVMIYLTFY